MPRAKAPTKHSDAPKPPSRRKARPKFEVAPEQVAAPAAGWVYRDSEPAPAEPVAEHRAAEPAPEPPPAAPARDNPASSLPMMAFGVMAVGIGAFVHIALFAVKTLNSPVRMATGLLGRLRRA